MRQVIEKEWMEKELSPRQKKSLETRKRIFDATYQLVNQYGEAYTVQDVCRLASVSVGSFYHFYKSKEEVTSDLYLVFDEHLEKEFPKLPEEPRERLLAITREMMRYSLEWGLPFLRLSCAQTSGEKESDLVREKSASFREIIRTLKAGEAQGIFHCPRGEEYYARYLITLFRGTLHWWTVRQGNIDGVERMEQYTEDFLKIITV